MATKVIPQQTIYTCDRCGDDMTSSQVRAKLMFRGALLDMQGSACANGDWDKDICDKCWFDINEALNSIIKPTF